MNCGEARNQIPFYCYGECEPEVEERVEAHLAGCVECRAELERHRAFLDAMDHRAEPVDGALLASCRADLRQRLQAENTRSRGWMERLFEVSKWHIPLRIPVGAMALVALGWLGARYMPQRFGGVAEANVAEPMFSTVRSIEPDGSGRVEIAVDDIRRRVLSGSLGDPHIQSVLLTAAREESNPGVRVESIGILQSNADSEPVRNALLDALRHDPNAGVRLKALEGLKPYAGDEQVRQTLADVLLKDDNPGVRVQAIDLLTTHHDDSIVGVLQDVVQREENSYVRARCRNLLEQMNASVGTY
ncbi:MAG TPA: HEAT repeat domain-containing protein [Bryobacteraceae bacterium]|nr:HEAT repeat domain-containing protein [Bryobacteraceae bacterium]